MYIDVIIPLLGGLYLVISGDKLIPEKGNTFIHKKGTLRKVGWILIGISILYLIAKVVENQ